VNISKITQDDFKEWLDLALKLWSDYSATERQVILTKILQIKSVVASDSAITEGYYSGSTFRSSNPKNPTGSVFYFYPFD
jgi:hypothetical protein